MLHLISRLVRNDDGVTAIEYTLIAALIAVSAVTFMTAIGSDISSTFETVASSL